jgi:MscS family membrane protein
MTWLQNFFNPNAPYFMFLLLLGLTLFALVILPLFKRRFGQLNAPTLINACVTAVFSPLRSFLLISGLILSINIVNQVFSFDLPLNDYPVFSVLAALHLGWYGFRIINTFEHSALNSSITGKLDKTAITGIAKVLRLLLVVILTIVGFDLLGLDPRGLIALGSVSGAALAFASKDLVSNWFGGIMLYLDKPFKVGDWIRSPDREIEGVVEYIGWRITKIRTFDKRPLYVPNSLFNNITVQNPSRMTHRRIEETIGVRYNDMSQVEALVKAIEAYLQSSDRIAQDQIIIVNLNGFGASSLDILIYCMTITTDWQTFHQHKQQVLLDIANLVEQHGCEFAFPTQTLHVENQTS